MHSPVLSPPLDRRDIACANDPVSKMLLIPISLFQKSRRTAVVAL